MESVGPDIFASDPREDFSRGPKEDCLGARRRVGSLALPEECGVALVVGDARRRRGFEDVGFSSAEDCSDELVLGCLAFGREVSSG